MKGRDFKMRNYSVAEGDRPPSMPTLPKSEGGRIIAVIHFAALKAVGESVSKPLQYYRNNIGGLLNLLEAMSRFKVNRIVFSSSAVVYGSGKEANISEDSVQVGGKGSGGGLVTNPYGRSKWMAEEILNDYCIANPEFECISLRYFNPTGSHPSGLIGEDPKGIPNNIVPVILQTYQRRRSKVYVYGSNYDTADGTGVRDYIHVEDLARGHLAALRSLLTAPEDRCSVLANGIESEASAETDGENASMSVAENYRVYNLGTGHGYSVLDIINAFAKACGTEIPFAIGEARSGDLGIVTASTQKAATELGWQAQFDIQDMCRDVYTFASENPTGYERLRKLSVLAIQDPSVVRKVSVAAGLVPQTIDKKDISAMIQNYVRASQDAAMFDEMVRSMNVLSPSLDKEFNFDSNSAPGMAAVSGQTGMFGEVAWDEGNMNHASPPPRRDSGVHA
ncbi:putative gal10 bifunctional protein [Phaeomoniella chlamydospora]|uniref:Putative gal10 bifunctional protein n=1 Tax=Phaeomoniella chlamydospora TaxID=158046 RepID=A0A0G2EJV1_PHACM|nr:putative gal10 bifunctional protein [Phaeomoniella chlamydospora]